MFFNKHSNVEADAFWRSREEELGTSIRSKALGRVIQEGSSIPLWGLFYTTAEAVYFQTFESESWMSLLFAGNKGRKRTRNEIIAIPASSLIRFELMPPKKGLLKIFRQPPLVNLTWKDTDGGREKTFLVELEGDAKTFIASIQK